MNVDERRSASDTYRAWEQMAGHRAHRVPKSWPAFKFTEVVSDADDKAHDVRAVRANALAFTNTRPVKAEIVWRTRDCHANGATGIGGRRCEGGGPLRTRDAQLRIEGTGHVPPAASRWSSFPFCAYSTRQLLLGRCVISVWLCRGCARCCLVLMIVASLAAFACLTRYVKKECTMR